MSVDLAIFKAPTDDALWPVLARINSQFQKERSVNGKLPSCVACQDASTTSWVGGKRTTRSTLWSHARCGSGHGQTGYIYDPANPETSGGLCYRCDKLLLKALLTGKFRCSRDGCRRRVGINEAILRKHIVDTPDLKRALEMIEASKTLDCIVHMDTVKYTTNKPPSSNCKHDQNVCDLCLRTDFESKIQRGPLGAFVCPDLECKEKVPANSVREVIGSKHRYGMKLALLYAQQSSTLEWCKCGRAGQLDDRSTVVWKCTNSKCRRLNCRTCGDLAFDNCFHMRAADETLRRKWENMRDSAKQAVERKRIELREKKQQTQELMMRTTKLCPKRRCGIRIERKSGCAHISCPSCRTEFCWVYKVIWVPGIRHLNTCPMGRYKIIALSQLDKRDYADGWQDDGKYDSSRDEGLYVGGDDW
ncbi:hypothetical protein QBC38DRAFT_502570 [Podospora fimiseda]|uniref:RING-type domain-containing protein n=1 Tax=Podospora fimiseda TaxID=252190 RepID=A0AAN7BIT8_9PEZI|nr:hypothetical protein QBC38DRAFT_502570 [Podospora fimiseda]